MMHTHKQHISCVDWVQIRILLKNLKPTTLVRTKSNGATLTVALQFWPNLAKAIGKS